MQTTTNYCVVGMRPDGSPGIRLYSENRGRANLYASYIHWRHIDWAVRIEARESAHEFAEGPQDGRASTLPR